MKTERETISFIVQYLVCIVGCILAKPTFAHSVNDNSVDISLSPISVGIPDESKLCSIEFKLDPVGSTINVLLASSAV
ncbi:hypothetical protein D3C85_1014010 [compost metagenome]